jgi:type IV secretory pathway VirB4 component
MADKAKATQDFVPIKEVRNGVVMLKDGSLRSVLMASSLNFSLKSTDEQQAIIFQFQNLLNSLDFPIQFFVQSRELDIRPYLALLEDRYKNQTIDLLKIQVREYIDFIKGFTEAVNIMDKSFFVVIPYTPPVLESKGGGMFGSLLRSGGSNNAEKNLKNFEEHRSQLEQRVGVVLQGLGRTGIRVVQLGTEEVVELFYKIFNPGDLEKPLQYESKES